MNRILVAGVAAALLASCAGRNAATPPVLSSQDQTQSQTSNLSRTNDSAVDSSPTTSTNFAAVANGLADAARVTVSGGTGVQLIGGPIALATLGCNTASKNAYSSAATLNVAPYATSSGTAADSVASTYTASTAGVTSSSTIQGVNVLGGLITATALKAQANSSASAGSATSDENGSDLAGLVVAGVAISQTPAENTTITLPGLGYVTLNEVKENDNVVKANGSRITSITVHMIDVHVTTANTLGAAVGTEIVVGNAYSALDIPPAPYDAAARAYSLYIDAGVSGTSLSSGRWSDAKLDCLTGYGSDQLVSATTPVGSLSTMDDTVRAVQSSTGTAVHAASDTASASLLSGLVSAQGVVAKADVTRNGSSFTRSAMLTFVSLTVGGHAIAANVGPNTRITLAGLGYAVVNRQTGSVTSSGAAQQIEAVRIVVTSSNAYGLPAGAIVVLGHARAAVTSM